MGLIMRRNLMAAKSGPTVEYLSYIQSDGSAWVDTGYVPQYYDSFEIEMAAINFMSNTSCFFGCIPSNATRVYTVPGYVFSAIFTDRRFTIALPFTNLGGGNGYFWNNANEGNEFYDGLFHVFNLSSYKNSTPEKIIVDGVTEIPVVFVGWSSGTVGHPMSSISIFGAKTELGTCIMKAKVSSGFKFRRLKFYDADRNLTADIRAARQDGVVGVFDEVAQTFHTGVDGVLTGVV